MNIYSLFGMQVRMIRKMKHLTLEDLSERSGLSTTHINNIELGKSKFYFETACRLSWALEVQLGELYKDVSELTVDTSVNIPKLKVLIDSMPKIYNSISELQQLSQDLFDTK